MTKDDREIVSALRAALADKVGNDCFQLWLAAAAFALRDGVLVVAAPTRFHQEYLRNHLRAAIAAACQQVLSAQPPIEFTCQPAASAPKADPQMRFAQMGEDAPPVADSPVTPVASPVAKVTKPAADAAGAAQASTGGGSSSPSASATPARRLHALDRFVPGEANAVAWSLVRQAADEPARVPALFLYGPTSVGKTHLLEGLYRHALARRRPGGAVLLTAEQFTAQYIEAVRGGRGVASFQRKCRGTGLLAIDDIQFLLSRAGTLGELVRTIDALLAAGRQLVLAADRPPQAFRAASAELASRLAGAAPCQLQVPEFAARLAIVRHWAAELALDVPDEVATYVATHLTGHARELIGALKRLRAVSLAQARPVTPALAVDALADLIHGDRVVRLDDVAQAVCRVLGVEPAALVSKRKSKDVLYSRTLAMFLARKYTRAPLAEIGAYFGRRSHATVIGAQRKVAGWMTAGGTLELDGRPLKLEETIRRVESQLRAG